MNMRKCASAEATPHQTKHIVPLSIFHFILRKDFAARVAKGVVWEAFSRRLPKDALCTTCGVFNESTIKRNWQNCLALRSVGASAPLTARCTRTCHINVNQKWFIYLRLVRVFNREVVHVTRAQLLRIFQRRTCEPFKFRSHFCINEQKPFKASLSDEDEWIWI